MGLSVTDRTFSMTLLARRGVACASTIMTLSSPMMTPVFGSPSAVNAHRSRPISVKEIFFSVMSPVDANCLDIPSGPPCIVFYALLDRAEDRAAVGVAHLDAHRIAEPQERRLRRSGLDRLDGPDLGDAGEAHAAFLDRLAGATVELVGNGSRTDDRAGAQ